MTLYSLIKKHRISKTLFIIYFTFIALIFYFIFSIFFSQKGLMQYFSLKREIYDQDIKKKQILQEINIKKNKVRGMNSESLDLDLLDEEARKNLGYSSKKEIVIYHNDEKNDQK